MRQTPFSDPMHIVPILVRQRLNGTESYQGHHDYKDFQVNKQIQDSMQLKVRIQWNQNITNRNEKASTNGSDINTLVSTRRAWEVNWYPFWGKLWLYRRSIKGREERVKGDGSDVIICAFTRDRVEESLPLPREYIVGTMFTYVWKNRQFIYCHLVK